MTSFGRTFLRTSEIVLAVMVLFNGVFTATSVPHPYPTWPTRGTIPINPELVVPCLLGIAVLVRVGAAGFSPGAVISGILGASTVYLAITSLHALYVSQTGGVFWGGLYTLVSGVCLAVVVVGRTAARWGRCSEKPLRFLDR